MVWTIKVPTNNEGADLTGYTPEQWQAEFEYAYFRGNMMHLNALGVDTDQLRDYFPFRNWGSILELATAEIGGFDGVGNDILTFEHR